MNKILIAVNAVFLVLVLVLIKLIPKSSPIVTNVEFPSVTKNDLTDLTLLNNKFEIINDELARLNKSVALLKEKLRDNTDFSKELPQKNDSKDTDAKSMLEEEAQNQDWDSLVQSLNEGESSHDMDSELEALFEGNSDINYSSSCGDSGCKVTLLSNDVSSLQKAELTIMMGASGGNAEFYVPPRDRGNLTEIYIKHLN